MGLFEKIEEYSKKKNKEFTLQELYCEFASYKPHSIRARVYENSSKLLKIRRGVYIIVGATLEAIIEQADSREFAFELIKRQIYYDMIFFDIPYEVAGTRGGNRNLIDYPTISPDEFQKIILQSQEMLKTEESQVVFMISGGKTSLKQANKYTDEFKRTRLKLHSQGSYTKLYKNGKVCNMGRYPMPKEHIYSFSHAGTPRNDIEINNMNKDFRFERPPLPKSGGYRTEKPLALLKEIISRTTKKGEKILDMFAGSGRILTAAAELQRRVHLVELSYNAINDHILPKAKRLNRNVTQVRKELNLFDFYNI